LEKEAHVVIQVKNYWPKGDDYSGVNVTLRSPDDFFWEVQFHTLGSLAAREEGHPLYERIRLPETPITERRSLFDRLVARWDWVAIPKDILRDGALHEEEVILLLPRP
jgi:hypothetical protein